jgi:hypothetical protein
MAHSIFFLVGTMKKSVSKKAKLNHEPLSFSELIDLQGLLKKKTKVTLKRETLLKWSSDKITMPFEIFEGDEHTGDMTLDITKYK